MKVFDALVSAGKFKFYDSEDPQPVDTQISTELQGPIVWEYLNHWWCGEHKHN
jgi:uncharacterized protein (DUF2249 family)